MKEFFRIRLITLAVLMLLIFTATAAYAAGARVFDYAKLFTQEQTDSLESTIAELREKHDIDLAVLTIDDAGGKTSRDYADDYYDQNGLGAGEDLSGVLLLIDMDNREAYISTCGTGIRYLTDARIESILDEVTSRLAGQDYYGAADRFLSVAAGYVNAGIPKNQHNYDTETGESSPYEVRESTISRLTPASIILACILGLAAGGAFFGVTAGRYKAQKTKPDYSLKEKSAVKLSVSDDIFVNQIVTQRRIQSSSGGLSDSSGRSSTHRSSGGTRHGGGGRKF